MTDTQLWLAVGLPNMAVILGMLVNALVFHSISARISRLEAHGDIVLSKLMDIANELSKVEAKIGS